MPRFYAEIEHSQRAKALARVEESGDAAFIPLEDLAGVEKTGFGA